MLATIAARLTDQLYFRCPLDPSKKAIYEYGIQLSLSTLASMCSIVLLGLLLKNPASAFIFLGVFFFLRLFSGGYHAPTYARCFLLTNSVYLAVGGSKLLDRVLSAVSSALSNRCGAVRCRDRSFAG